MEGEEEEEEVEDEVVEVDGGVEGEGKENKEESESSKEALEENGAVSSLPNLDLLRKIGLDPCSPEPPTFAYELATPKPVQSPEEKEVAEPSNVASLLAAAPSADDPAARLAYIEPTDCSRCFAVSNGGTAPGFHGAGAVSKVLFYLRQALARRKAELVGQAIQRSWSGHWVCIKIAC